MANPFPANFETVEGAQRLTGQIDFTDAGNQPGATFNGGTITEGLNIDPTDPAAYPLTIVPAVGSAASGVYLITVADEGQTLFYFRVAATGWFAAIEPDGTNGHLIKSGNSTLQVRGDATVLGLAAGASFYILDHTFATIFRVDETDGSVHIKTGTTVIADL